jgi:hypothetical protein
MNNMKAIQDSPSTSLTSVKKGDTVTRIMTRYNPQTGVYHIAEEFKVVRKNTNTVKIDSPYQDLFKISSGYQAKQSEDLYGSSDYSLYTTTKAAEVIAMITENGGRIRVR